ncbi:MAG: lysophospholipid acyltransferase family protein [Polyangia bacterium]
MMSIAPHIDPRSPDFPGDPSEQRPFGLVESLRSVLAWSVGIPHLAAWTAFVVAVDRVSDTRRVDRALKLLSRAVPALAGIRVEVRGRDAIDAHGTYVYVANHVNLFDIFVIYQAIPHYTRSLEAADHFDWPLFGPLITAAGQIPVDPEDRLVTARGLRKAAQMLSLGDSLVVLPEGQRTLDGSVGRFYPGAFRLAIQAGVPVVPIAIRGGRAINRRGDWRVRPGRTEVIFGAPVSTRELRTRDAAGLANRCRSIVIDLLQGRRGPGG